MVYMNVSSSGEWASFSRWVTIHPEPWAEESDPVELQRSNMLFPTLEALCEALPELTHRIDPSSGDRFNDEQQPAKADDDTAKATCGQSIDAMQAADNAEGAGGTPSHASGVSDGNQCMSVGSGIDLGEFHARCLYLVCVCARSRSTDNSRTYTLLTRADASGRPGQRMDSTTKEQEGARAGAPRVAARQARSRWHVSCSTLPQAQVE
jgi:hypothetical protein